MKNNIKIFTLLLMLAVLLLPASAAQARGFSGGLLDGRVIFGDNFTLESGDTLTGDLVVFGGNVKIEEDALVQGDMVVIGGNVNLDGTVNGSTVIVGGSTNMSETAVVKGDLVTVGGSLSRDPGSEIEGEVVTNIPAPDIRIPDVPSPPSVPSPPGPPLPFERMFLSFMNVVQILVFIVFISGLSMLTSLFLQPQIERVSSAVIGNVVISGSIGLLTVTVGVIATAILAITIVLSPVAFLVALVMPLAWLFGLIAIGTEVGERFTKAINQTWAPPLTAGMGTFLTMVVLSGIVIIPCAGWLVAFLVSLIGIGGVVLTVFGTQNYPRVVAPAVVPENNPVG